MKAEGSLPHSQQPATCPYSQPDRSSPCPHHISRTWVLILSYHLRLGLTCGRLPPYVIHVPPISVFLIWSPDWHLVRRTEHKAPRYVVFSTPLHRKNIITLRPRNKQIVEYVFVASVLLPIQSATYRRRKDPWPTHVGICVRQRLRWTTSDRVFKPVKLFRVKQH
jgi:hypothetical protein